MNDQELEALKKLLAVYHGPYTLTVVKGVPTQLQSPAGHIALYAHRWDRAWLEAMVACLQALPAILARLEAAEAVAVLAETLTPSAAFGGNAWPPLAEALDTWEYEGKAPSGRD